MPFQVTAVAELIQQRPEGHVHELLPIVLGVLAIGSAQAGPVITSTVDASLLANTIAGSGITISNATLTYNGPTLAQLPSGTFTGGASTVGFDAGIVLTNGDVACATGPNNDGSCSLSRGGSFDRTTLAFDFTSTTGSVFFQYVFGSEEYNTFVNSQFNDEFQLLLNGTNIALLPGGAGVVSINNVNCLVNSAFYRNNNDESNGGGGGACPASSPNLNIDIQYDGLTVVLTASGTVATGTNNFAFTVFDRGDNSLDSGVYIKAGSFSGTNPSVPEPGALALVGIAMAGLALTRRRAV